MRFIGYQEEDDDCVVLTFASESDCQKMMADGSIKADAQIIFETEQADFEVANKEWNDFRDKIYERDPENEEEVQDIEKVQKSKEERAV